MDQSIVLSDLSRATDLNKLKSYLRNLFRRCPEITSTIKTTTQVAYFGLSFANVDTTNLKWELPSAGTYLVYASLRAIHDGDAGCLGKVRLYDNTSSAAIANSDRMFIEFQGVQPGWINLGVSLLWKITVTQATTLYLQGCAYNSINTVGVQCDGNGFNECGYIKTYG